jgi:peroxiredoxin family protein
MENMKNKKLTMELEILKKVKTPLKVEPITCMKIIDLEGNLYKGFPIKNEQGRKNI